MRSTAVKATIESWMVSTKYVHTGRFTLEMNWIRDQGPQPTVLFPQCS